MSEDKDVVRIMLEYNACRCVKRVDNVLWRYPGTKQVLRWGGTLAVQYHYPDGTNIALSWPDHN